ncbi:16S rRNA (cytosine(1402)-N(4))-methyltransferase RsmH [Deltaproteobacteria bacterium TL4]
MEYTPLPYQHISVLPQEILNAAPAHTAHILDCTLGGGGHSALLLQLFPESRLVGIDRDPEALLATRETLSAFTSRILLTQSKFSQLAQILTPESRFDYVLADLGFSSAQIDQKHRGFSFFEEGPLDMRMTPNHDTLTAEELVNTASEQELVNLLRKFGEERFASRIVKKIMDARQTHPFKTTKQLAEFIAAAVPKKFHKPGFHPATQAFQALRIAVNHELEELQQLLDFVIHYLKPQGCLAIISFHSLEDRIVKQQFRLWQDPCQCPSHLPYCVCGLKSLGKVITRKPLQPTEQEIQQNPRSRSARLRVFERNGTPANKELKT